VEAREAPISETAAGAELPDLTEEDIRAQIADPTEPEIVPFPEGKPEPEGGDGESIAFKASQVAETFTAGKKGKKGKTDG